MKVLNLVKREDNKDVISVTDNGNVLLYIPLAKHSRGKKYAADLCRLLKLSKFNLDERGVVESIPVVVAV